jgi:hypothetical protein
VFPFVAHPHLRQRIVICTLTSNLVPLPAGDEKQETRNSNTHTPLPHPQIIAQNLLVNTSHCHSVGTSRLCTSTPLLEHQPIGIPIPSPNLSSLTYCKCSSSSPESPDNTSTIASGFSALIRRHGSPCLFRAPWCSQCLAPPPRFLSRV